METEIDPQILDLYFESSYPDLQQLVNMKVDFIKRWPDQQLKTKINNIVKNYTRTQATTQLRQIVKNIPANYTDEVETFDTELLFVEYIELDNDGRVADIGLDSWLFENTEIFFIPKLVEALIKKGARPTKEDIKTLFKRLYLKELGGRDRNDDWQDVRQYHLNYSIIKVIELFLKNNIEKPLIMKMIKTIKDYGKTKYNEAETNLIKLLEDIQNYENAKLPGGTRDLISRWLKNPKVDR